MDHLFKCDVLIIGGGIAGLWSAALLKCAGYSVLLLEADKLGSGQTLASQGMIHGGQRYSLKGAWTSHADLSSKMPEKWESFFNGSSTSFQLKSTKISSHIQTLWSATSGLGSVISFFASKAMQSKTDKMEEGELFNGEKDFIKTSGSLFKLPEKVIEVKSLCEDLREIIGEKNCLKAQVKHFEQTEDFIGITFDSGADRFSANASALIFTAGLGNEWGAEILNEKNLTQRRPLKQVIVGPVPYSFYGHCITSDPRPRITITSHRVNAEDREKYYWYLGGLVANYGSDHSDEETIQYAFKELSELFPKINWEKMKWSILNVDRAEPKHNGMFLPEGPELKKFKRVALAWPTKMTFAPLLAENVLEFVKNLGVKSDLDNGLGEIDPSDSALSNAEQAVVDDYPWDKRDRLWFDFKGKSLS